jgi:23S rRNA pseudouridine1911/1915/1917 synthase
MKDPRRLRGPDPLRVVYEDNHCLAVIKRAGLLTVGDRTGDMSLLEIAREYIRAKYHKPGRVYLGLVHRLDRPVSGVVLFARTSKAAARLSAQFRAGAVQKAYRAWVEGLPSEATGEFHDHLIKDAARNTVRVASPRTLGARPVTLEYRVIESVGGRSLVEVRPRTGRSHQIRVQLASRGLPIVGDVKYGSRVELGGQIALHAAELRFEHPTRREIVTVCAPEPPFWRDFVLR